MKDILILFEVKLIFYGECSSPQMALPFKVIQTLNNCYKVIAYDVVQITLYSVLFLLQISCNKHEHLCVAYLYVYSFVDKSVDKLCISGDNF